MDIGYFKYPYREAEIGKPQVTHWDWKLDYYGLDKSNLDWINLNNLRKYTKNNQFDSKQGLEIVNLNEALINYKKSEDKDFSEFFIQMAPMI